MVPTMNVASMPSKIFLNARLLRTEQMDCAWSWTAIAAHHFCCAGSNDMDHIWTLSKLPSVHTTIRSDDDVAKSNDRYYRAS
jgi:hypothetical protein